MSATSAREMLSLGILLASLAVVVGYGRSPSATPSAAPETAGGLTDAPSHDVPQVEIARDPNRVCCENPAAASKSPENLPQIKVEPLPGSVAIPDVSLVNQDGQRVRFRSDLVNGKIVAVNFIFTTCKGICPPLGANFAKLQERLGDRVGDGVELISVSVDPQIDTPQQLHAWRNSFGGGRGWTLLTGNKQDVDLLLKEMGVFAADKNKHSPFILLGDEGTEKWVRVHGLTAPERLAEMIVGMHDAARAAVKSASTPLKENHPDGSSSKLPAATAEPSPAENYFTNVELVNQHGERLRLYADLLQGKFVVINSFFSTCKGSCPVMMSSFSRIQQHFADRVGKDLSLISITVDPQTDTPQVLAALADQWKAKPGWQFLTSDKASVEKALHKLGLRVENKESHSNIFIIGNEATGLWKKARGLSKPEEVIPLIEEVLKDKL
jgi:protein SCO1/2